MGGGDGAVRARGERVVVGVLIQGKKVTEEDGAWCGVCQPELRRKRLKSGKYQIVDGLLEKHCAACDEYWPADTEFFYSKSDQQDSLWPWCKACYREKTGRLAGQRRKTASPECKLAAA